jgi:hypothetical protein
MQRRTHFVLLSLMTASTMTLACRQILGIDDWKIEDAGADGASEPSGDGSLEPSQPDGSDANANAEDVVDSSTGIVDSGMNVVDSGAGSGDGGPDAALDSGVDSPPAITCDGGPTVALCGSSCVDLATTTQDCRVCGHDCGEGSSCLAGVCQPALLYSGAISGFAVDSAGIYFSPSSGTEIESCPLTGCTLTPTVAATAQAPFNLAGGNLAFTESNGAQGESSGTNLVVCLAADCTSPYESSTYFSNEEVSTSAIANSSNFFFWGQVNPGGTYLISCSPSASDGGCATTTSVVGGTATHSGGVIPSALAASDSFVYFSAALYDAGAALYSCPTNLAGCAPTPMNPPAHSQISAFGSDLYILPTPTGPTVGMVKCPSTGCGGTTVLTVAYDAIQAFVVDQSGVYWTTTSSLETCPLTGCGVAPVDVATGQNAPEWIHVVGGFVYWVNGGDTIWRVAVPPPP